MGWRMGWRRSAARCPVGLRLAAVSLRSGALRLLGNADLSPASVLASATVPCLFQAVEIAGEPFCSAGDAPEPLVEALRALAPADEILVVATGPGARATGRPGLATLAAFGIEDQLAAAGCEEARWDSLLELHAIGRDQADLWLAARSPSLSRRVGAALARAAG